MRVAIVDDSRLARVELKQQLTLVENIKLVAEADNVQSALKMLSETNIDLLLLDIDLPDGTGFDLLEQSSAVPDVIFVTAFDEFAIKSFDYNALDYLLKPVRQDRLNKALDKVKRLNVEQKLTPEKRIFIKDREQCFFVSVEDIFAFEAMGNYTRVHIENGKPCVYRPISAIEARLDKNEFFRASRSFIINTRYIVNIAAQDNGSLLVTLKNGAEMSISKRQASEFKRVWAL